MGCIHSGGAKAEQQNQNLRKLLDWIKSVHVTQYVSNTAC